jgi:predicted nucleic acid-binding protein
VALVYFDASALVKLVVEEDGSELATALWDGCDRALSSRLSFPEVCSALAAATRDHRIATRSLAKARRDLERFWSAVQPVELTPAVERHAGELASAHSLRGADAVHLASALAMDLPDLIVAVWDHRLREGVLSAGLRVAPA